MLRVVEDTDPYGFGGKTLPVRRRDLPCSHQPKAPLCKGSSAKGGEGLFLQPLRHAPRATSPYTGEAWVCVRPYADVISMFAHTSVGEGLDVPLRFTASLFTQTLLLPFCSKDSFIHFVTDSRGFPQTVSYAVCSRKPRLPPGGSCRGATEGERVHNEI